ncbi:mRNA decay activator protein ZFP36L2-A-like [Cherax quadricarinatus]|uniref:mRNA decay activator protein ZFP36L2-A-like n=1 Tax=Cherax quadricarinatus TaxID=27406 RepID=UPI00387EBDC8
MGNRSRRGRSAGNSIFPGKSNSNRINQTDPRKSPHPPSPRLRTNIRQRPSPLRRSSPRRQFSPLRRLGPLSRFSPVRHSSPRHCSSRSTCILSRTNEGNYSDCLSKQDSSTPLHFITSESTSFWKDSGSAEEGGSKSCNSCCSTDTHALSSSTDNSNGTSSSTDSNGYCNNSKRSVRPMPVRPSNPLRYKTELCRSFEENEDCKFGSTCTFAHGLNELRAVPRHPRYKTDLCRTYHSLGYCQYGTRCHFVHDLEEAAGISPMRGHRLRSRHDKLGSALLTLAENAGIAPDPSASDVLLANLRRLYAIRILQENADDPNLSASRIGTTIDKINTTEIEPVSSRISISSTDSNVLDNSLGSVLEPGVEGSVDMRVVDISVDSSIEKSVGSNASSGSDTSTSSTVGRWWEAWYNTTPRLASNWVEPFISNPMEVSRSLQLPTIAELSQMPYT